MKLTLPQKQTLLGALFIIGAPMYGEPPIYDHQQVSGVPQEIEGQTFFIEGQTLTTEELINQLKKTAKTITAPSASLCQPCQPTFFPPPLTRMQIEQNPDSPAVTFYPDNSISNSILPPPQSIGSTFTAGNQGINPTFSGTPPDTMGVIGPKQFVMAINQGLVSFDREGNRTGDLDCSIGDFLNLDLDFSRLLQGFDPRIRYDKFSDRFYFICINRDATIVTAMANNGFSIAVSDSGILTKQTKWKVINIFSVNIPDSNGCPGSQMSFIDYPQVGIDKHALYITLLSIYPANGSASQTASAFVVQKESLLKDGPAVITTFPVFPGFPPMPQNGRTMPADNFDEDPKYGYMISPMPFDGTKQILGQLLLYRISNPGSKHPTLSPGIPLVVPNTSTGNAPAADYQGNPWGVLGQIASAGAGADIQMAHIRNKQLYTIHSINVTKQGLGTAPGIPGAADRKATRWYQIDVTGDSDGKGRGKETETSAPALVQAGTLWDSIAQTGADADFYTWPAIMTNKRGDMSICGTISGKNTPLSAFFVGRLASDPLGQLRIGTTNTPNIPGSRVFAQGAGLYTRNFAGGQRWGDYSYSSLDPLDDTTMWTIQEIAKDGLEQLVVARLDAPNI